MEFNRLRADSSLSFPSDLVRGVHARATRKQPEKKKEWSLFCRASPVSRLQPRAWSFACLGRFARQTNKKERLLVV